MEDEVRRMRELKVFQFEAPLFRQVPQFAVVGLFAQLKKKGEIKNKHIQGCGSGIFFPDPTKDNL